MVKGWRVVSHASGARIGQRWSVAISNRGNFCMVVGCWTMWPFNAGNATGDRANNTGSRVSWTQRAAMVRPYALNARHAGPTHTQCNDWRN